MVDLVGNHGNPQGGDLLHPGWIEEVARRIGGGIDQDPPGAGGNLFADGLGTVLKAVFLVDVDADGNAAEEADEIGIAGVVRIGDDDLVARADEGGKEEQHGGRRARCHDHLVGADRNAVAVRVVFADRFPELQQSQAVRVVGLSVPQRPDAGFLDARRRIEVGLPHFEVNDVFAPLFHLLGLLEDVHDDEGRDIAGAL